MATLEQFLRAGELGPIGPGMSEDEVIAVLGEPEDTSVSKHPRIFKYGALQLTFVRGPGGPRPLLSHIGLYYRPGEGPIPAPAAPADFKGGPETTPAEFRRFLADVGLNVIAAAEGDDTEPLILPSGARVTFDDHKLYSIHYSAPTPARARKQISVSIPEDAWDRLRILAGESKRSVSDLCAEWIAERANGGEAAAEVGNGRQR